MDNPEKLAKMLEQQQAMKFLQSMQSGMANGYQGAMGEAERMQMQGQPNYEAMTPMAQEPMQSQGGMPVINPQGDYGMPMPQQSYSAAMPTNPPQMDRRGMLQGAVNSLGSQGMGQGMGQGAMSNKDLEMMRRR
jgi:hypothetical protein